MTIWLDVTTILKWHRPAVGVVRVETEVARFLVDKDAEVYQFCEFDNEKKRFYRVNREEVANKLDELASLINPKSDGGIDPARQQHPPQGQWEEEADRAGQTPAVSRKSITIIKKPLVGMVISGWKIFYAMRSFWHSTRNNTRSFYKRLRITSLRDQKVAGDNESVHPFERNDIYISVGMDWEHKDWDYFYPLRSALHLKTLLCCYDLIPIMAPGLTTNSVAGRFPSYILSLTKCADKLMCISTYTKKDLDSFLSESGQALPDSEVFYLGTDIALDSSKVNPSPRVKELVDGTSFIMLVSTIERRKGHDTVYRAYQRLVERNIPNLPLLVFVGMPGWGVDDLLADIERTKRVAKYIRFLSHVSDRELTLLYQHCLFTVFPSVYEGWGLPVSESLTHGKFCLASSAASIPEAGGEFCEYLDPWDVPLWTERLNFYFANRSKLQDKETLITQKYKPHTWLEAADKIVSAAGSLKST